MFSFPCQAILTFQAKFPLALTTGMIPESAGLDRECPGAPLPKVAAIVDWYGITDVNDLLDGPNRKSYAVTWLSSMPDREQAFLLPLPVTCWVLM